MVIASKACPGCNRCRLGKLSGFDLLGIPRSSNSSGGGSMCTARTTASRSTASADPSRPPFRRVCLRVSKVSDKGCGALGGWLVGGVLASGVVSLEPDHALRCFRAFGGEPLQRITGLEDTHTSEPFDRLGLRHARRSKKSKGLVWPQITYSTQVLYRTCDKR